jgi:hypothetical protein
VKRAALLLAALATGCGNGDDSSATVVDASSVDVSVPVEAAGEVAVVDAGPDVVDAAPDPCADAAVPPPTIACTGLYADLATKELAPSAMAYTPSTPLWSDDAQKQRWIELPPDTKIDISNPSEWSFPIGTKLFKEFRLNGKRVETRMFQKTTSTFWVYATYAWNGDDSAAAISFGGPVLVGDAGVTWNIPTNDDCNECHRGRQDRILGFEEVSLGLPGAQGLTLAQLAERGLVTPAPANVSLNVGDDGTGLSAPALAWLHVNCGVTCHNANPAAAGSGAGMLLRLDPAQLDGSPPNPHTWDILKTTVNVPCVSGSLVGVPRIRPNNVAASAIHQVIDQRGALQMPPIASRIVDTPDVAIVAAWIQSMVTDGGAPPDGGFQFPDGGFHFPDGGFPDGGHLPQDGGLGEAGIPEGGAFDAGSGDGSLDAADATVSTGDAEEPGDDADEAGE